MERTVDIEPIDMRHQKPKGFHLDDQLYIKTGNVYEVDPTELPKDFKFQSYSYGNRVYLSNKHQIWLKAQEEDLLIHEITDQSTPVNLAPSSKIQCGPIYSIVPSISDEYIAIIIIDRILIYKLSDIKEFLKKRRRIRCKEIPYKSKIKTIVWDKEETIYIMEKRKDESNEDIKRGDDDNKSGDDDNKSGDDDDIKSDGDDIKSDEELSKESNESKEPLSILMCHIPTHSFDYLPISIPNDEVMESMDSNLSSLYIITNKKLYSFPYRTRNQRVWKHDTEVLLSLKKQVEYLKVLEKGLYIVSTIDKEKEEGEEEEEEEEMIEDMKSSDEDKDMDGDNDMDEDNDMDDNNDDDVEDPFNPEFDKDPTVGYFYLIDHRFGSLKVHGEAFFPINDMDINFDFKRRIPISTIYFSLKQVDPSQEDVRFIIFTLGDSGETKFMYYFNDQWCKQAESPLEFGGYVYGLSLLHRRQYSDEIISRTSYLIVQGETIPSTRVITMELKILKGDVGDDEEETSVDENVDSEFILEEEEDFKIPPLKDEDILECNRNKTLPSIMDGDARMDLPERDDMEILDFTDKYEEELFIFKMSSCVDLMQKYYMKIKHIMNQPDPFNEEELKRKVLELYNTLPKRKEDPNEEEEDINIYQKGITGIGNTSTRLGSSLLEFSQKKFDIANQGESKEVQSKIYDSSGGMTDKTTPSFYASLKQDDKSKTQESMTGFGSNKTGFGFGSTKTGFGSTTGFGQKKDHISQDETPKTVESKPTFGSSSTGFGSTTTGFGSTKSGFGSTTTGFGSTTTGFGSTTNGFGQKNDDTSQGETPKTDESKSTVGSSSTGFGSTTTGFGSSFTGFGSTKTGFGSSSTGFDSIKSGFGSTTTGFGQKKDDTSQGEISKTDESKSTVGSSSTGFGSTTTGFGSTKSGFGSTTTGFGSSFTGFGSTKTGFGSTTTGFGSSSTGFDSIKSGFGSTTTGFGQKKDDTSQGETPKTDGSKPIVGSNTTGFGSSFTGLGKGSNTTEFTMDSSTKTFGFGTSGSSIGQIKDETSKSNELKVDPSSSLTTSYTGFGSSVPKLGQQPFGTTSSFQQKPFSQTSKTTIPSQNILPGLNQLSLDNALKEDSPPTFPHTLNSDKKPRVDLNDFKALISDFSSRLDDMSTSILTQFLNLCSLFNTLEDRLNYVENDMEDETKLTKLRDDKNIKKRMANLHSSISIINQYIKNLRTRKVRSKKNTYLMDEKLKVAFQMAHDWQLQLYKKVDQVEKRITQHVGLVMSIEENTPKPSPKPLESLLKKHKPKKISLKQL